MLGAVPTSDILSLSLPILPQGKEEEKEVVVVVIVVVVVSGGPQSNLLFHPQTVFCTVTSIILEQVLEAVIGGTANEIIYTRQCFLFEQQYLLSYSNIKL